MSYLYASALMIIVAFIWGYCSLHMDRENQVGARTSCGISLLFAIYDLIRGAIMVWG